VSDPVPRYEPMLATPWPRRFADPAWAHEVKWDGVRCLLRWDGVQHDLVSRTGKDMTARYPELAGFRAARPCVLDGELVATEASGRPSFGLLQSRMNLKGAPSAAAAAAAPVTLVVFDVLYDGVEVIAEPWWERRRRLEVMDLAAPLVRSEVAEDDPEGLWGFVTSRDLEGIVSKRMDAPYRPGIRSQDWRKIVNVHRVRAVVGGYLPGTGGRSGTFGSLLVGLTDGEALRWIGAVGTGFDDAALRAIRGALDEMVASRSPFHPDPDLPGEAVWVAPSLVAVVEFREWTAAHRLRAPSFKGFSDDDPATVTWEREGPAPG
jgi:bifunctional non-homologous end joining protein LigD